MSSTQCTHVEHLREVQGLSAVVDEQLARDEDKHRRNIVGRGLRVPGHDLVLHPLEWQVLRSADVV